MSDDTGDISQAELVEYCRTQAGILAGHLDRLSTEVSDLLEEIEQDTADARAALTESPERPETDAEATVADIEAKQERAQAKQAEIDEYRTLAEGYTDLAEQLADGSGDLESVLEFEIDTDAPSYFDAETTILGVATGEDRE
jgi:chromosome segregation ATPase